MEIKLNPVITIEFKPEDYFLLHNLTADEWSLNYKIDMSYKGKSPDIGMGRLFLDKSEVEEFKKYFDLVEL